MAGRGRGRGGQRNHRKQGKRGYRLHDARVDYSGGTKSMRTIKYPLDGPVRGVVHAAIVADHRALWGITNFADYCEWQERRAADSSLSERPHSFLGLWLLALRLGFMFNAGNETPSLYRRIAGAGSFGEQLFHQLPADRRDALKPKEWIAFVTKDTRGLEQKDADARRRVILSLLKDPASAPEWAESAAAEWVSRLGEMSSLDQKSLLVLKREIFGVVVLEDTAPQIDLPYAMDPGFPVEDFAAHAGDPTALMDALIGYYDARGVDPAAVFGIGGVAAGSWINGFYSQFFPELRRGESQAMWMRLQQALDLDDRDRHVVVGRLDELVAYAEQLPQRPALISAWKEYRADTDGTLASWFSNLKSKREASVKAAADVRAAAVELRELLERKGLEGDIVYTDACGLIDVISSEITDVDRGLTEAIFAAQSALRVSLNEAAQQHDRLFEPVTGAGGRRGSGSEKDAEKAPLRRRVEAKVPASPLFFGESQRSYFEKAYRAKQEVSAQVDIVAAHLAHDVGYETLTAKHVQQLAVAAQRADHPAARAAYQRLADALGVDFAAVGDRTRAFWMSPFARRKPEILPVPHVVLLEEAVSTSALAGLLSRAAEAMDWTLLRDAVNLSKVLAFAVLASSGSVERSDRLALVTAHSELSGLVAMMSRLEFITRYGVQSVNGAQVLLGRDDSGPAPRYAYAFPDLSGQDERLDDEFESIGWYQKDDKAASAPRGLAAARRRPVPVALRVVSSKVQVQFLDWLFRRPRTKATDLKWAGPFTIAETDYTVDWSGSHPRVTVASGDRHHRVYTSQPFEIVPDPAKDRAAKLPLRAKRQLGVDIGEYGLAWCAIEVRDGRVEVLGSGFLADPGQRSLGRDVKALRERHVAATFMATDTHLARLREHLLGTYRARLQDLAIRYDAPLAFELEVSAFEAGGAKVAKLYDSLKRGDIWGRSDAAKADNKQAWGSIDQKGGVAKTSAQLSPWAVEVTAAGTSQTCSRCGRYAAHAIRRGDGDGGEVRRYSDADGLVTMPVAAAENMSDDERRAFARAVYAAMRPNLDGVGMDVVREAVSDPAHELHGFDLAAYTAQRGNSAIFVCQYLDCGHIADADLQAALNIAVRGWLKSQARTSGTRESAFTVDWYEGERRELAVPPMGLSRPGVPG